MAAQVSPAAPELAQPCWDAHDDDDPMERVCAAVGVNLLLQRTRTDFVVTKFHTSCKRSQGGGWGKASSRVQIVTPYSDAALGRAQPDLQKQGGRGGWGEPQEA